MTDETRKPFKKGDTVRVTEETNDNAVHERVNPSERGKIVNVEPASYDGFWDVEVEFGREWPIWFHSSRLEAWAIDPADVKEGGTVTLERDGAKVIDRVADVDQYQDGDYRFKTTTPPTNVYRVGEGAWALTGYTPPVPQLPTANGSRVRQSEPDVRGMDPVEAVLVGGAWVRLNEVPNEFDHLAPEKWVTGWELVYDAGEES